MRLGENIYKLRTERKMSQEDFAAAMEVSRQSVSKWENDMAVPELEKLLKMAKLFEVSLDELVGNASLQTMPGPASAPAPGITTGDLICAILLLLGVILPVVFFFFGPVHIGLFAVPPCVTFCAAVCSPKSKLFLQVFGVYNLVFAFLTLIMIYPLGLLTLPLYILPYCYWSNKQNS